MVMPQIVTVAQRGRYQVGECAESIAVQEITDDEKLVIGMEGEIQLVLRFPCDGELRVPVTAEALRAVGIAPPSLAEEPAMH